MVLREDKYARTGSTWHLAGTADNGNGSAAGRTGICVARPSALANSVTVAFVGFASSELLGESLTSFGEDHDTHTCNTWHLTGLVKDRH